ncbi:hypothetical protein ACLOJK_021202 [Asimina triloba]
MGYSAFTLHLKRKRLINSLQPAVYPVSHVGHFCLHGSQHVSKNLILSRLPRFSRILMRRKTTAGLESEGFVGDRKRIRRPRISPLRIAADV